VRNVFPYLPACLPVRHECKPWVCLSPLRLRQAKLQAMSLVSSAPRTPSACLPARLSPLHAGHARVRAPPCLPACAPCMQAMLVYKPPLACLPLPHACRPCSRTSPSLPAGFCPLHAGHARVKAPPCLPACAPCTQAMLAYKPPLACLPLPHACRPCSCTSPRGCAKASSRPCPASRPCLGRGCCCRPSCCWAR